jgi:rhomboid family GlyGly-CTERM serine protease
MNFRAFSAVQLSLMWFALLLVLLQFVPDSLRVLLEYRRELPEQSWRFFTGHLLHSNLWHLLMNLGALALILLLHQSYYRLKSMTFLLIAGCLLISAQLYFFSPDIKIYLGLSGWLHCLIVVGALLDIQHKIRSGWLIFFGAIAKVVYEQWQGPDAELGRLIDANVAIDAHLYGVLSGVLLGLVLLFSVKPAKNPAQR